MQVNKILYIAACCILSLTYASNISERLCESQVIAHCNSAGYASCRRTDTLQECYCVHSRNWTKIDTILDDVSTCKIDSGKYLDPNYWFRDVVAATFVTLVILFALTWCYLIPAYAKISAMYVQAGHHFRLCYLPFSTPHEHQYSIASPNTGSGLSMRVKQNV